MAVTNPITYTMTKTVPLPGVYTMPPDLSAEGDLSDMLSELRILLPGAQMLSAFLIILPFNGSGRHLIDGERTMFLATFICALTSLILLSAPAIQHRLMRPLVNRSRFKRIATRQIVAGSATLACAFILGTHMVISQVFDSAIAGTASGAVTVLLGGSWWLLPLYLKRKHDV